MRRIKTFVSDLPPVYYGLLGGLFAFGVDTGVFLAEGKSTGLAIGTGIAVGVGAGVGCAVARQRGGRWRKRFATRYAKPS